MMTVDQISDLGLAFIRLVNVTVEIDQRCVHWKPDDARYLSIMQIWVPCRNQSRCVNSIGMDSCIADCVATAAVAPWAGPQSFLGTAITYSPRGRDQL
jgi:hypothetical protein